MLDERQAELGFLRTVLSNTVGLEHAALRAELFTRLISSGVTISDPGVIAFGSSVTLSAAAITSGLLAVARGGTNLGSYTIGDLLYADGATSLAKLAGVATGNALISGGVGAAPSWGQITNSHIAAAAAIAYSKLNLATSIVNADIAAAAAIAYAKLALTNSLVTGDLTNDAVTDAKLRNGGALSVIGRSANSSGDPADISATAASDAVLRESGSALGFGPVATAGIANAAITYAKIQNVTDARLLGRSSGSAGPPIEVTVGSGLSLAAGALTATAGQVTLLKANSGTDTNAAATNVDTVAISGLTAKDVLRVVVTMESVTQQTSVPRLYSVTDSIDFNTFSDGNGTSVAAGESKVAVAYLAQMQNAATQVGAFRTTAESTATFGASRMNNVATTTAWTGAWTLALRHAGVTAGGTFRWSWQVIKIAGQ